MSLIREIYQQTIIDHGRKPRNFHALEAPCIVADGQNRSCGDSLRLYASVVDNVIEAISFTGEGCAIAVASASLLTEVVSGMRVDEALALFQRFHQAVVVGEDFEAESDNEARLSVFLGVQAYPARVKCATLAWQTLIAVLENPEQPITVSTE